MSWTRAMLASFAMVAAGMAATAGLENPAAEFCTTEAHGWPLPWRIDYCPCEGGKTVYPVSSVVGNAGMLLVGGMVGAWGLRRFLGRGMKKAVRTP